MFFLNCAARSNSRDCCTAIFIITTSCSIRSEVGWPLIKGVVGELEYVGAVMRNPAEGLELFLTSSTIERRLEQLATRLNLATNARCAGRLQAVLSAIWSVEDGFAVDASNTALRLAESLGKCSESETASWSGAIVIGWLLAVSLCQPLCNRA
jgi:hypothetical protein